MSGDMVKATVSCFLIIALLIGLPVVADESDLQDSYRLGSGDKLQIMVFNQEDLSGEYVISGSGRISMSFIGRVQAEGLTLSELTDLIVDKLKPDYLLNPRVNIEILDYRPFYIMGEVEQPNSYPFVEGMSYLNAVAIASGYTYRAKKSYAMVRSKGDPESAEHKVKMTQRVQPGDVIRILERKF
jgi:protein involved in polysaccharide export with SLBB domain